MLEDVVTLPGMMRSTMFSISKNNRLARVDCEVFAAEFGQPETEYPCYFSQLDLELVITELDIREIFLTLLYCISIPVTLYMTAVAYLVMACWYIYPRPVQVRHLKREGKEDKKREGEKEEELDRKRGREKKRESGIERKIEWWLL